MSTTALLPIFRRAEFQGRTDKYAPPTGQMEPAVLTEMLKASGVEEVAGSVLSDRYVTDSISRISGYSRYWRYYSGKHFDVEYDGGNKKVVNNYCQGIIDKRAAWVAGKGFTFYADKGNDLVAEMLDKVWTANKKRELIRRSAKISLCAGDTFWYFTVKTKDAAGKDLPKDAWQVRINIINPSYCWPIYTEDDPQNMKALLMQFSKWDGLSKNYTIFTAVMTAEKINFYENHVLKSSADNPLGLIPVVHIPSSPVGDAVFGRSALEPVIPLNDDYNEVSLSVRKIIRYHGEPTTIVYGAKLSNMERGANKVWSNLPPPNEARVENLEMKSDLAASYKYLEDLEKKIYRFGKTPRFLYDPEGMSISNTSGIAMQLLFSPILEPTSEEQDSYSNGISKGNAIIAEMHRVFMGEDLQELADEPKTYLSIDTVWSSLLPKDEQMEIDMAEKKIALGIWSVAEAARRLAGVRNTEKLAMELAADKRQEIALVAEKENALKGRAVNYSAPFLGSIFLSEDLLDTATEIAELTDDNDNLGGGEDL